MTLKQKKHQTRVINSLYIKAHKKYAKGAEEHGGDLLDKSFSELLLEIQDEAIDTFMYAEAALERIKKK